MEDNYNKLKKLNRFLTFTLVIVLVLWIISLLGLTIFLLTITRNRCENIIEQVVEKVLENQDDINTTPTPSPTNNTEEVKFTTEFLGLNSEWAPTQLTVTEPYSFSMLYPAEFGDITAKQSNSCTNLHDKPEISLSFNNIDATMSLYTCGVGGGGYEEIEFYTITTTSGELLTVTINEYSQESDYYLVTAEDEDLNIYVYGDLIYKRNYDNDKHLVNMMLESIDLVN